MNCKRQGMAILVMEAMTKCKERHYLTVPKEHQEMLKANNNYKAFYQMTMEDLHDSDIPEYRRLDKKDSRNISLSAMLRHRAISLLSI